MQKLPQLEDLVRLAGQAAKSDACSLFKVDPTGTVLVPVVLVGLPQEYVAGIGEVEIGSQCCGRAVAFGKPWIVRDMLTDPLFVDGLKGAQDSGIRAAFSVPVRGRKGEIIGSLACHYRRPYTPTNVDIERNELYAKLIGFAMQDDAYPRPLPLDVRPVVGAD
jgi:GAF domain-containing protein